MTAGEVLLVVYATLGALYVLWLAFLLGMRWYVYRELTVHDLLNYAAWPVGLPLHMMLVAKREREDWRQCEWLLQHARENPDGEEPGDDVSD